MNNAESLREMGSHWSLLAYNVGTSIGIHMDSMRGSNNGPAGDILRKINSTVSQKIRREPRLLSLSPSVCPQQQEGYNCGIYSVLFAECLARFLLSRERIDVASTLSEANNCVWREIFAPITPDMPDTVRSTAISRARSLMEA